MSILTRIPLVAVIAIDEVNNYCPSQSILHVHMDMSLHVHMYTLLDINVQQI